MSKAARNYSLWFWVLWLHTHTHVAGVCLQWSMFVLTFLSRLKEPGQTTCYLSVYLWTFVHEGSNTHVLTKTLEREWLHINNYTGRAVRELTYQAFTMHSLNRSLSFWLDDIMTLHALSHRHDLLLFQLTAGRRERERGRAGGQKCPYLVIHACFCLCPFCLFCAIVVLSCTFVSKVCFICDDCFVILSSAWIQIWLF